MENWQIEVERIKSLLKEMEARPLSTYEYQELQLLLQRQESIFRFSYPLCNTSVTGNKIMFIADTHSGNVQLENRKLVNMAYDRALQMNIKAVVHAGDLTEACPVEHDKGFDKVLNELETAKSDMPDEITTGLLLGNHDYSAIRTHPDIIPHYFNSTKLYVLGMNQVLLNWNGLINLLISHPISQLHMRRIEVDATITLEGHHHFYNFYEDRRTIDLPSLSSDTMRVYSQVLCESQNLRYCPLFVVASKCDEHIITFEVDCIDAGQMGRFLPSEVIEVNTKTKQLKLYK